jgi:hypothetical protein
VRTLLLAAALLAIEAVTAPEGDPHRHALHLVGPADAEPACTIYRLAGAVSGELGIGPPACVSGGALGDGRWMFDLCERSDADFAGRVLCVSQGGPGTILAGEFR